MDRLGLESGFGKELDIHRNEAAFTHVTVRQALAHTSGIGADVYVVGLFKGGAVGGNRAYSANWFPGPGSTRAEDDTVDVLVAFNCSTGITLHQSIQDAVNDVERRGLWSPEDLTGGSDFDEEEP